MLDRLSRYAPFTGIIFVVLVAIAIFTGNSSPGASASGARVIAYYTAHKSAATVNDVEIAFAFVFFLFFIASLYGYLRNAPAIRTLSLLGFLGALMFATGFVIFAGIDLALASAAHTISPAAAQALNVLDNQLFLPFFVGAIVFGVGTGLAVVRSGLLPAWLGWAVLVFGIAAGTPAFFVGIIGLTIWALVVSVLLYQRSGQSVSGRTASAPTAA